MTLRELSTELQQGWIERLFSRFAALYGAAFGRQWEGTNLANVKTVWAEKLGGFNAAHIGEALKNCDEHPYPPNLPEFIDLCRQSARRSWPLKPVDTPQLSPAEIKARSEQLASAATKPDAYDYQSWCKELKKRYLSGERMLPIQIALASEAMGETWEKGECMRVETAA